MKTKLLFLALLTATVLRGESVSSPSPSPSSQPPASNILPADHPAVKEWRDRRFGMFIHWGPVSLKGTEIGWSRAGERRDRKETIERGIPAAEYDELYKQFNPVKFNADEWVTTAKEAGMKYIVLVTKHHDGFCMFDSALTDYKITSSPFGRDVTAELAEACRKQGLAFGVYYSPPDWHHPDFCTADHARYVAYMHGQVKELLTKYGPLSTIWFDRTGGVNAPSTWNNPELFRMIRELQPMALVNTRCGGKIHEEPLWGDYLTPEQKIGGFDEKKPWETCMTISRQWAWKPNDQVKSLEQCLRALIFSAGGDGNLLFNVGPTPEGLIEPRQVERLKEMGAWLSKYGESIYGTRGGPYKPAKDAVSTRKGNSFYLHILKWPEVEEAVVLPPLPAKITASNLLTGGTVTVDQTAAGLRITVPPADRKPIDTIVKLDLDRNAMEIEPITIVTGNPLSASKASASSVMDEKPEYSADKAADGNPETRWSSRDASPAWLEFEFAKPMVFDRVEIEEAGGSHVEAFDFQAKDGGIWRTLFTGKKMGPDFVSPKFTPVTASAVRLNIVKSKGAPSISEIRLLGGRTQ